MKKKATATKAAPKKATKKKAKPPDEANDEFKMAEEKHKKDNDRKSRNKGRH